MQNIIISNEKKLNEVINKMIKEGKDPIPVLDKDKIIHRPPILIREGTLGDCPHCGSTSIKRWIWFGKIIGCINPGCSNYYYK